MDYSTGKYDSKMNRPIFVKRIIQILYGFSMLMIGFFRVTDEERIAAGIHIDYEKQESPANFHL
jgi:hypothetical protein